MKSLLNIIMLQVQHLTESFNRENLKASLNPMHLWLTIAGTCFPPTKKEGSFIAGSLGLELILVFSLKPWFTAPWIQQEQVHYLKYISIAFSRLWTRIVARAFKIRDWRPHKTPKSFKDAITQYALNSQGTGIYCILAIHSISLPHTEFFLN